MNVDIGSYEAEYIDYYFIHKNAEIAEHDLVHNTVIDNIMVNIEY